MVVLVVLAATWPSTRRSPWSRSLPGTLLLVAASTLDPSPASLELMALVAELFSVLSTLAEEVPVPIQKERLEPTSAEAR